MVEVTVLFISGQRSYFRWSVDETDRVKHDFKDWISVPEGNSLPGKKTCNIYYLQYI